ncbi:MAG TPA: hypothetical protein PLH11_03840 [Gemmobacter sp.]|nr:hypothetical protein [Gemmobacter sp.]
MLKRIILLAVFAFLALAVSSVAYFGLKVGQPKREVMSPSGALVCSRENYADYLKVLPQAGRMGIDFFDRFGDDAALRRMLIAFDALALTGPETVVVAGERARAQLYTSVCRDTQCTLEEMTAAQTSCMEDNMADFGNGCVYLALRYQGSNFCFIAPAEE